MSTSLEVVEQAQRIYSDAYSVFLEQISNIAALRKTVVAGIPIAKEATFNSVKKGLEERKELNFGHDPALLAKMTSESTTQKSSMMAEAAYLVFTHSIVDALLFELLRVISLLKPETWETKLKKKLSLEELKGKSYEELRKSLLDKYLKNEVEMGSLVFKAELILNFCGSPIRAEFLENYTFDRGKLEEANNLRRETVHGVYLGQLIPAADQSIEYLEETGLYFTWLLSKSFPKLKHPVGLS